MKEETAPIQTTTPEWMLACNGKGVPIYWIAVSGERRDVADPPPRDQWHHLMQKAHPHV